MKDDGGPAFPQTGEESNFLQGMSLRDYFAAHCPSDICDVLHFVDAGKVLSRPWPKNGSIEEQSAFNLEVESKMRYAYADAMLAERAK